MTEIKFSDSVDIRLLQTDKFTRNLITVSFIVPLDGDASLNSLLAGVMKLGNADYKDQTAINNFLDENYGATFSASVTKIGENQVVRFSSSFISDKYTLDDTDVTSNVMKFLTNMIKKPLLEDGIFRKEYLETESRNIIDKIHARINNKRGYAVTKCIESMCAEEAYSVDELGVPEEIAAITPSQLYGAYKKLMTDSKVLVIGSGDLTEGQLTEFTSGLFDFPRNGASVSTLFVEAAEDVSEVTEKLDVNQAVLCLGFRTGAKSYKDNRFAYMVFCSVFGGSATSYLFMNVREKLSLCYFCSSSLNMHKGIMLAFAGIAAENKQKALDEIIRQLDRLRQGDITETDMDGAYKMLINQFLTVNDGLFSLDGYYLNSYIGGNEISAEDFIAGIKAVTMSDVIECAKKVTLDTVYFLTSKDTAVKEAE